MLVVREKEDCVKECLFIGGPNDGQWKQVDTTQLFIRTLKLPSLAESMGEKFPSPMDRIVEEFTYRAELFGAEDERHQVYVLSSMTIKDAMRALLDGYKP